MLLLNDVKAVKNSEGKILGAPVPFKRVYYEYLPDAEVKDSTSTDNSKEADGKIVPTVSTIQIPANEPSKDREVLNKCFAAMIADLQSRKNADGSEFLGSGDSATDPLVFVMRAADNAVNNTIRKELEVARKGEFGISMKSELSDEKALERMADVLMRNKKMTRDQAIAKAKLLLAE